MTDSMKLHNPFLISIDTYYKTRIYSSRFFISRCRMPQSVRNTLTNSILYNGLLQRVTNQQQKQLEMCRTYSIDWASKHPHRTLQR